MLYVLDEPTIGLHPRDTRLLVDALQALIERGNSVLVVEHDLETIEAADLVIDMGPGGGRLGGSIVAQGTPARARGRSALHDRPGAGVSARRVPVRRSLDDAALARAERARASTT